MKIQELTVEQKRLSTAEAELWVVTHVDNRDATTELRGSLVGPRCAKAETVQIAYPLRSIERAEYGPNALIGRIIIPEPNCWTPEMPFVYEGSVELWQAGKRVEIKSIQAMFKLRAGPS